MDFTTTREEMDVVFQIIDRIEKSLGPGQDRMTWAMDLSAAHANGSPMDFAKLLDTSEETFRHDVLGIRRHIDRTTGELGDCFVPRCALPEAVRS